MPTLPKMNSLFETFNNEEVALKFLQDAEIFQKNLDCPTCGSKTSFQKSTFILRYLTNQCRKAISVKKGTFFAGKCLPMKNTFHWVYLWLSKTLMSSAIIHVSCSSATATTYYGYFRQLVANSIDENQSIIGREGIVVKIDKTKMGKKKYNKGHRVDRVWVVRSVEKTKKRLVFAVTVEK
ncbi:Hypothetical protein SRAE_0000045300 [Strongyloides ratti]|uniref:Transposase, ISXO2-like domain-containing protein n=1 Tax=Strongyloides ratti TaxID=34506 RepID=A0A090KZP3_STRRB|nr:Hypothetical protein SRAE_0000045300 [Strongyloides ratti]CEF61327.1 Hypothetical protein SRAE_0000045300 [Strongyloides ratti]